MAVILENKDDLQRDMYHLKEIGEACNVEISREKPKIMGFRGNNPVRSKIVVLGKNTGTSI